MKNILFILIIVASVGCNKNDLEYIPIVKIYNHINGRDVEKTTAIPPIDWGYYPIQLQDTCDVLINYTQPLFLGFWTEKDSAPDSVTWYYDGEPINLYDFLGQFGVPRIYYHGVSKGGTLTGTNNPGYLNKIYCKSAAGIRTHLVFQSMTLQSRGAMSFGEFLLEIDLLKSFKRIGFQGTGYTCLQIEFIMQWIIDECIDGTGRIIDMRNCGCTLPIEISDILESRGFEIKT